MTIEEYIASQLDGSVTADRIEFIKFESSESSYMCDTCGPTYFNTTIHYKVRSSEADYKEHGYRYNHYYGEIDRQLYLDESDVAKFLNAMFPEVGNG